MLTILDVKMRKKEASIQTQKQYDKKQKEKNGRKKAHHMMHILMNKDNHRKTIPLKLHCNLHELSHAQSHLCKPVAEANVEQSS